LKSLPFVIVLMCITAGMSSAQTTSPSEAARIAVRISWGHTSATTAPRELALSGVAGADVLSVAPRDFEDGETLESGVARTRAGGGDVDALDVQLSYPVTPRTRAQHIQVGWTELIANADSDTARRLTRDPAFTPGAPALIARTNAAGTAGFTVTIDQLLAEKAIWIPSFDLYLTSADAPVPFDAHMQALAPLKGQRILERVRTEPEATYAAYASLWDDLGSPDYVNPHQIGPGHIVGLTWDSAIPKFGIDRAGGVSNDDGNPDKFRFWFAIGDLSRGVSRRWKGQHLDRGLPVVITTLEEDGVRYELEQFAYPLNGPPPERRGDIPMVLLQQLTLTELRGAARSVPVSMTHRRQLPPYFDGTIEVQEDAGARVFRARGRGGVLLSIAGGDGPVAWNGTRDFQQKQKRLDATVFVDLPAKGTRRIVVKLPSPIVPDEEADELAGIDYAKAREAMVRFWSDYIARGAQFSVPEQTVNELFRANLWHALRLPRRHGAAGPGVDIDLPYSNFAYSQTGTPWPVNQAVYVDYMLYALRGYHDIATEELAVQYRNNQEADGHVSGYANWLVYTPAMLYAVAQNYLLSDDRAAFDRLLPQSLDALDWCLGRLSHAQSASGPAQGLVRGPLNDNTGDGFWAFNQAYLFAGLDLFGRALDRYGHPRAGEARHAAAAIRDAVARAFGAASMRSPIVQLRDRTWTPYVPAEALSPHRILDEWYPTDVDTGATHLLRLEALPARGTLADALLNDHEDNLYYKGRGIAQEPVYNQQATAYLLRDAPEAVVRAFYSYMASGFSHTALEPVEHYWGQGQYFGPPSTDGAWFELYRNMLVHETADDALAIAQATPRAWLRDGQTIEIRRAPTYYGNLDATIASRAARGEIQADIQLSGTRRPAELRVRFRHPDKRRMRSVTVNGRPWSNFDADGDWVKVPSPGAGGYVIVARY
jgi:hypothetical protein